MIQTQTLLVFPNTNWTYNILSYFNKFCLYDELLQDKKNELAILVMSDYKADNPYNTFSFSNNAKKISQFLEGIKPNTLKETLVAYEKALNLCNLFMWTAHTKRIIFFYHNNPHTPNYPYNQEKLFYLDEANKLKKRGIEIIPIYINNPANNYMLGKKIETKHSLILNNLIDLNLLINYLKNPNESICFLQEECLSKQNILLNTKDLKIQYKHSLYIPSNNTVKDYIPLIFKTKRAFIESKKYSNKILKQESLFEYELY